MDPDFDLNALALKSMPKGNQDEKKIIKKAYDDALYQFYKTLFSRQMVSDFMTEGIHPCNIKDSKQLLLIEKAKDSISTKPPYMLVTVNPKPGVTLSELRKKVEKYISRKIISHYAYAYEVRKKNEGLHVHILCQYTTKPYDFKRATKSTFKTICDSNNNNILNFKFVTEEHLESKYNYLKGIKQDKKKAGVKHTAAYRKDNKLDALYESNPPLPCRVAEIKPLVDEPDELSE